MRKLILSIFILGAVASINAQNTGNVGINMPNPTATLHIKANGNSTTTQALKVEDSNGANLFTINNDGSVSGTAATNLASGTAVASKGSGMFTATVANFVNCFLSPNGNTTIALNGSNNDPGFYTVAQTVPYNTVVDKLSLTIRATATIASTGGVVARLYVNGVATLLRATINNPDYTAGQTFTVSNQDLSIPLVAGDLIAYRITGLSNNKVIAYVAMRYAEQ